jgi:hypothetical protein
MATETDGSFDAVGVVELQDASAAETPELMLLLFDHPTVGAALASEAARVAQFVNVALVTPKLKLKTLTGYTRLVKQVPCLRLGVFPGQMPLVDAVVSAAVYAQSLDTMHCMGRC